MLTTNQKGALAETALTKAALEVGYDVYRPMFEGGRYDLVFDTGERLLRVQCKWAPLYREVIVIRSYSCRRDAVPGHRRRHANQSARHSDEEQSACQDSVGS